MDLSSYFTFVLVSIVQVAIPGPSTLFLVNSVLTLGRLRALEVLSGDLAAITLLATLSAAGLAGLLASYPSVCLALRLMGAAYVLWLGWVYLRPERQPNGNSQAWAPARVKRREALSTRSFAVGISNPKAVLFFTALFPQFIPESNAPAALTLLVLTFVVVKFCVLGGYALGAHQLSHLLRKPGYARRGRMVTGGIFVAFGASMIWSAIA